MTNIEKVCLVVGSLKVAYVAAEEQCMEIEELMSEILNDGIGDGLPIKLMKLHENFSEAANMIELVATKITE